MKTRCPLAAACIAILAASCGGTTSDDTGARSGADGGNGGTDAATDGRAPGSDSGAGSGSDATAPRDGAVGSECASSADCRAYGNNCNTCACIPLPKDSTDPVCSGTPVNCIVDPCQGKSAACAQGVCVIE